MARHPRFRPPGPFTFLYFAACLAALAGSARAFDFDAPFLSFSVHPGASALAVADLNHDGHADAVVAGQGFQVLLGQAPAGFAVQTPFGTSLSMDALVLADMNGDGQLDAVGAIRTGGVAVALGHGDGTFAAPVTRSAGTRSLDIAAGDLDGDGKLDVLLADTTNTSQVLIGKGNGTFNAPIALAIGHPALRVALGDIDGDGKLDAVTQRPTEFYDVLLGHGNGTFDPTLTLGSGPGGPSGVALVDLVGDARPEIVVGSTSYRQVEWHTFDPATHTFGSLNTIKMFPDWQLVAKDLNGDGIVDIAGNGKICYGAGGGSFPTSEAISESYFGGAPQSRAAGDVDGDGHVDFVELASGSFSDTRAVRIFPQRNGAFRHVNLISVSNSLHEICTPDLNNDGRPDVVADALEIFVGIAHPGGSFDRYGWQFYHNNKRIVPADMDRDGIPDLVLTGSDYSTQSVVTVWKGRGDGSFDNTTNIYDSTPVIEGLAVGDLNGDPYPDVLAAADKGSVVLAYAGDASAGLTPMGSIPFGAHLHEIAFADLDGDGHADLLGGDASLGGIRVRLGHGGTSFGHEATAATMPDPDRFQVADPRRRRAPRHRSARISSIPILIRPRRSICSSATATARSRPDQRFRCSRWPWI